MPRSAYTWAHENPQSALHTDGHGSCRQYRPAEKGSVATVFPREQHDGDRTEITTQTCRRYEEIAYKRTPAFGRSGNKSLFRNAKQRGARYHPIPVQRDHELLKRGYAYRQARRMMDLADLFGGEQTREVLHGPGRRQTGKRLVGTPGKIRDEFLFRQLQTARFPYRYPKRSMGFFRQSHSHQGKRPRYFGVEKVGAICVVAPRNNVSISWFT